MMTIEHLRQLNYIGFVRYDSPLEQPAAQAHREGLLRIDNLTMAGIFYRLTAAGIEKINTEEAQ